mmetsp:Transcript_11319/g.30887  ORF Transcript_11319/g.30887 Transcript_11319/m.30887 type:complete len:106 (-) Transcript_11319:3730-4047(-)
MCLHNPARWHMHQSQALDTWNWQQTRCLEPAQLLHFINNYANSKVMSLVQSRGKYVATAKQMCRVEWDMSFQGAKKAQGDAGLGDSTHACSLAMATHKYICTTTA